MMRMKLRRNTPKNHRTRRTPLAAGAIGAAAESVRRDRQMEQSEH
jgi:hypothetical protein